MQEVILTLSQWLYFPQRHDPMLLLWGCGLPPALGICNLRGGSCPCFSWIPDSQVPDFCRRLLWVILGSSITHHQASKGNSHIQVQDCLCHVCFALNFSVVVVETFFPGVIYKRCFDSGSMWVVCVSGSAHSALPTVAPSSSLLFPPILCTVPWLSPSSLPPGSLPPTHCFCPPTLKKFAGSTAVFGGRKLCSSSCSSRHSSELHEDTDYLSTCFREVQLISDVDCISSMEMPAAQNDAAASLHLGSSLPAWARPVWGGGHSGVGGCKQTAVLPAPLPGPVHGHGTRSSQRKLLRAGNVSLTYPRSIMQSSSGL